MPKILFSVLSLLLLAVPAWAQEQTSSGGSADTTVTEPDAATADEEDVAGEAVDTEAVEEEEADDEDVDDSDLDEQTYEEDDNVFVPTEEIPADEPIPFPSNI